jgi:hypothetical protein
MVGFKFPKKEENELGNRMLKYVSKKALGKKRRVIGIPLEELVTP